LSVGQVGPRARGRRAVAVRARHLPPRRARLRLWQARSATAASPGGKAGFFCHHLTAPRRWLRQAWPAHPRTGPFKGAAAGSLASIPRDRLQSGSRRCMRYLLSQNHACPKAGRTHSRGPAVGSRAHALTAPPRGPAHVISARNAQASSGTKDEGTCGPMARVLGQMRASTDPLSAAKGPKERAHFGLSAGKWPRRYRRRKQPRITRRPFQECPWARCSPRHLNIRSSLPSRSAFFARVSFAVGHSWWAFAGLAQG
jgi:hypothetical protein